MRVSGSEASLYPLHSGDRGALLRSAKGSVSKSRGNLYFGVRAREDWRDLLCAGMDTTLKRGADHSVSLNSATAVGKYWTAWRRNSGPARSCVHPGIDRHSHAL